MGKRTKILYGIESAGGGSLKHLVYLVTKLSKEKFEITVIYSNARNEDIRIQLDDIKNRGVNLIHHSMSRNIHLLKDIKSLFYLLKFINKSKFDIVHAHSSKAGFLFRLAAYLKGVERIFYTPHCFYFQSSEGIKKRIFIFFEKILATLSTKIIVSESEYRAAIDNKITKDSKLEVINNAISFEMYKKNNQIRQTLMKYNIKEGNFIVGSIGRLSLQKDWETYIYTANEVLKKYPRTVFLIVGSGEQEKELRRLIIELDLESKIKLTGYVTDIHNIYGIIDVFVSTSLWEGLPYVFLEAMQYKKAIVATNSTNQNMIFSNDNAYLCPVKDYKYISRKIISLIEDKQLAKRMGEKGRELLERKYSFELFAKKHLKLYN
ncbi:glycosyltransferase family 4 protein [Flavobacterium undicola]|uniref:glycosyltransferase family 4 protein n=1 Tax=Flavobacterium undicola TaxID=1932779 RepID=UPI001378670E|nr:glycosyltransferase family 4 protein [Flavobacterium undicola]MBA0882500.1 glycosyltransferase family 4 protein [Flavobacterium undicola]